MFVELHMIQNFAPANLNRDDTNAPKDCVFGGYRRARISSQCLKRAMRTHFATARLLPADRLAKRTRLLCQQLSDKLADCHPDPQVRQAVITAALAAVKLEVGDDGRTQYLLFLGADEVDAMARVIREHWDSLAAAVPAADDEDGKKTAKQRKRAAKQAAPKEVESALSELMNGAKAADLALFGRMLADIPAHNIDAACQVAHAISTHRVDMEFDFYTAVDDLQSKEETGAGMMGTIEFNASCFYRYANIDACQLLDNLKGDVDLARATIAAFLRASVEAIPTGKQNSMAAHNPPSFVFAVVRERGLCSLANAFARPVFASQANDHDLVSGSVTALVDYWHRLTAVYGADGVVAAAAVNLGDEDLASLGDQVQVPEIHALVERIVNAVDWSNGEATA